MNSNVKLIALAMACAQLFSCATDGYRANGATSKPWQVYDFRSVGQYAQKQYGESTAVLDNADIQLKLQFQGASETGYIFHLTLTNQSQDNYDALTGNFFCEQRNANNQNNNYPVMSEFEALADYDRIINSLNSTGTLPSSNSSSDFVEGLGVLLIVFALFSIFFDHDNDRHVQHSQHTNHSHYSQQPRSGYYGNHGGHHHHSELHDFLTILAEPSQNDSYETTTTSGNPDAARKVAELKQQQKDRLFKSKTLNPGEQTAGLIYCPFNAAGDLGMSFVYGGDRIEFKKITDTYESDEF